MGGHNKPHQTEDTAFIKENQRRESRSINKFINDIPGKMPRDHRSQTGSDSVLTYKDCPTKPTTAPAPAPKSAPKPVDPSLYPRGEVEVARMNDLSMKLWKRVNAGYLIPYRRLETDYTGNFKYNERLIGKTDRSFMHKRDMFSEYVEYAARMKGMMINKKPLDRPLSRGKPKTAPAAPKAAPAAAAAPEPGPVAPPIQPVAPSPAPAAPAPTPAPAAAPIAPAPAPAPTAAPVTAPAVPAT